MTEPEFRKLYKLLEKYQKLQTELKEVCAFQIIRVVNGWVLLDAQDQGFDIR